MSRDNWFLITQQAVDESTAGFYETHAAKVAHGWEALSGRERLFAVAFPEGARVLDIGSGSGRDLARLLLRGYDALGVEPTAALRALSVQFHPELAGRVLAGELPNGLPELGGKFDGVLCSAVWQHLTTSQFFDAVYSIKNLLNPHGRVLVTVSGSRPGLDESSRDEFGRLCTTINSDELSLLFARTGFQQIGRWTEPDSRGRGFDWTTLLFELRSPGASRPLDMVESVLNRDKKVATYKLALFRALCDLALTQPHGARWLEDGRVAISIEPIAERWILYYWPLFESLTFLPQMNGEWTCKRHQLSFAPHLYELIAAYRGLGGLSAYAVDRRKNRVTSVVGPILDALRKKLYQAIRSGPVTYAGGSLRDGRLFQYERGRILLTSELWSELCLMGHWIQDALVLRWAELTSRLSQGAVKPEAAIGRLLMLPDPERETSIAREIFEGVTGKRCVWTGRELRTDFAIDHLIPFTLWHNNDLWNLLPVAAPVNSAKSDRLPTRRLLFSRRDAILEYWRYSQGAMPERFRAEADAQSGKPAVQLHELYDVMMESVEITALQRGCPRWEP